MTAQNELTPQRVRDTLQRWQDRGAACSGGIERFLDAVGIPAFRRGWTRFFVEIRGPLTDAQMRRVLRTVRDAVQASVEAMDKPEDTTITVTTRETSHP